MDSTNSSNNAVGQQPMQDDGNLSQVAAPVSGVQKEQQPLASARVDSHSEWVTPSETEAQIPKELSEVGIEAVASNDKPQLTKEHKDAGLEHAGESTPIPSGSNVQLPMTEGEAKSAIAKEKNITNAFVWLATSVLRQIKILHRKLINTQ